MTNFPDAISVLSAMITPAVLISACGTLILSTSNRLGRVLMTKLKVYKGPDHPHSAQQPAPLKAAN